MYKSFLTLRVYFYCIFICMLTTCVSKNKKELPVTAPSTTVVENLQSKLSVMGARNWIVISEAAFPIQNIKGLEVFPVEGDIPEVLALVEEAIEETHHVKPRIYVTSEINHVDYDHAPDVKRYRLDLKAALQSRQVVTLDHDLLLEVLKSASKDYRVLVVKTEMALPYASVFLELGSGYWDRESETFLRDAMEKKQKVSVEESGSNDLSN